MLTKMLNLLQSRDKRKMSRNEAVSEEGGEGGRGVGKRGRGHQRHPSQGLRALLPGKSVSFKDRDITT